MRRAKNAEARSSKHWLQECLQSWAGRQLCQVRFSAVSLIVDFWETGENCSVWVYADEVEVVAAGADHCVLLPRAGAEVVGFLHSRLGVSVSAVVVTDGRLVLSFCDGSSLSVGPGAEAESWVVVAEAWGTVSCGAGGVLTISS